MAFASMPASMQMMMMRYWIAHHRPARLTILRASSQALPLEIKLVGHDAFATKHGMVRLTRYTVANLMFGREILWMNDHGRLAALMTFAGGLPQEELLDEYADIGAELVRSGVQQEMLDLDDLDRQAPPAVTGAFAIVGARLIDGTGAPAVDNSVVLVQDGRIVAAGPAASTPVRPACASSTPPANRCSRPVGDARALLRRRVRPRPPLRRHHHHPRCGGDSSSSPPSATRSTTSTHSDHISSWPA